MATIAHTQHSVCLWTAWGAAADRIESEHDEANNLRTKKKEVGIYLTVRQGDPAHTHTHIFVYTYIRTHARIHTHKFSKRRTQPPTHTQRQT